MHLNDFLTITTLALEENLHGNCGISIETRLQSKLIIFKHLNQFTSIHGTFSFQGEGGINGCMGHFQT